MGVHESTVSRATANKFVQLPTRKVIPFSDFFTTFFGGSGGGFGETGGARGARGARTRQRPGRDSRAKL